MVMQSKKKNWTWTWLENWLLTIGWSIGLWGWSITDSSLITDGAKDWLVAFTFPLWIIWLINLWHSIGIWFDWETDETELKWWIYPLWMALPLSFILWCSSLYGFYLIPVTLEVVTLLYFMKENWSWWNHVWRGFSPRSTAVILAWGAICYPAHQLLSMGYILIKTYLLAYL